MPPSVHSQNHEGANTSPHATPAATWGMVWCPSHMRDRAIVLASGTTTSGGAARIVASGSGKDGCTGRRAHARHMYVAKKVITAECVEGMLARDAMWKDKGHRQHDAT